MKKIKKLTPTLRFKEFSGNWNEVILGDISEYRNGGSYESRVVENGIYDLITLNSIGINGKLKNIHQKVNSAEWFLKKNDIVMVLSDVARGYLLGANDIIPEDDKFVLNQRMGLIRLIDTRFDSRFIHWSIISSQKYFKLHGQGSSQKNLSKSAVINYVVVHPSFEEQIQIAGFFDLLDERICIQEKIVETLEQLKKGYMQKIFSQQLRFKDENGEDFPEWEEKRLGDIGEFATSSVDKKIYDNEKLVYMVNYMDVYKHKVITKESIIDLMQVTAKDSQIINNNLIRGDILFTPSSETPEDIGHSIVIIEDLPNTVFSYHVLRFRPKINIDIGYSHYFCNVTDVRNQIIKLATGSTRFTVGINNFASVVVKVPSLVEQKKIAEFMFLLDEKIYIEITMLTILKNLKSGYLQQMFI